MVSRDRHSINSSKEQIHHTEVRWKESQWGNRESARLSTPPKVGGNPRSYRHPQTGAGPGQSASSKGSLSGGQFHNQWWQRCTHCRWSPACILHPARPCNSRPPHRRWKRPVSCNDKKPGSHGDGGVPPWGPAPEAGSSVTHFHTEDEDSWPLHPVVIKGSIFNEEIKARTFSLQGTRGS